MGSKPHGSKLKRKIVYVYDSDDEEDAGKMKIHEKMPLPALPKRSASNDAYAKVLTPSTNPYSS